MPDAEEESDAEEEPGAEEKSERSLDLSGTWLGYELHDGLLQWLVGARMQAESALANRKAASREELLAALEETHSLMVAAAEEGRELISFLEGFSSSESLDVRYAIANYLQSTLVTPVGKEFETSLVVSQRPWPKLPQRQGWNILRIVQQAVRNASAHSQADGVVVDLGWGSESSICAIVRDEGIGFDVEQAVGSGAQSKHFGVESMIHRARMLGGSLRIDSSPGKGCRITLIVPEQLAS